MSITIECLEQPFLTFTNAANESNYMGEIEELAALHRRTEEIDRAIREGKEFDVILDMLYEDGQDPCEYVESVGEQIEQIITYQLIPEDWDYWQKVFK